MAVLFVDIHFCPVQELFDAKNVQFGIGIIQSIQDNVGRQRVKKGLGAVQCDEEVVEYRNVRVIGHLGIQLDALLVQQVFKETSIGVYQCPGQQVHPAVVEAETTAAHKVDVDANLLDAILQHVEKAQIGGNCRV